LLGKARVADAVNSQIAAIAIRAGVTRERVERGLLAIAELDPAQAFNSDGTMKVIHEMPLAVRQAMVSVRSVELTGETKEIRFSDRIGAWRTLAQMAGLMKDMHEVTGKDGKPIEIDIDLSGIDDATIRHVARMLPRVTHGNGSTAIAG
jgi:hypothetical protein